MSDGAQPPAGGAPRFRIVAGRGLGERPSPAPSSHSPHPEARQPQIAPQPAQHVAQVQMVQHQQIGLPMHQSPQLPSAPGTPQSSANSSHPNESQPQPADDQVVGKCVRFFRTLICLSQQPDHNRQTAQTVNELVSTVIFGNMPAEEFTRRLQDALKSQAQPHLLPFLQRTLPFLRSAISNGEVVIDGINPPPGFHVNTSRAPPPMVTSVHTSSHPVSAPVSRSQPPVMPFPHLAPRLLPLSQMPPHHPGMTPVPSQPQLNFQNQNNAEEDHPPPQQHEEDVIQVRSLQENALKYSLLRPEDIMKKITQRMNEACYVEEEVLTLISDATEYRMRELLVELAVLAEHRVDPLRLNPNYGPLDDTRRQLRFLESLDRQQEEQRENREKEALIRMSKSKGIAKDTIDRAKEMQRADAEAKRNRDANAAAIAALSGNKSARPKWDQVGGSSASNIVRPRTVRVNIRDLHALVNHDPLCSRTNLIHKLALSGGQQTDAL